MKNLKSAQDWKGVWTALITPFDQRGQLDSESLQRLIENQILGGVCGLVVAGSTGEGSLLENSEFENLIQSSVRIAHSRIPIVAGVGIGGSRDCLAKAEIALRAGASGLLASPPAYIRAPGRGLVEHFKTLASLGSSLCLYDVPSRSASSLSDEVIDELLDHSQIHALKDATGKPARIANKEKWKCHLALLSGDDESFPAFIEAGGHGIISVASHFALADFLAVLKKSPGAAERFQRIIPFIQGLYWESNPIPSKSLATKLEWIRHDRFQAPLCSMKPDLLDKLYDLYQQSFT